MELDILLETSTMATKLNNFMAN